MSNLFRFKLAWIFSKSAFWISLIVPFFASKNISADQVFFLLSVYYFFIVILEYPTGVIGDYFSHKFSITIGYFICFIGMVIPIFTLPMFIYYIDLFILALGITLISGSDEALLYKLSKDFKKDIVNINSYTMVFALITITLGGFFGNINVNIPVLLDALLYFFAFLLMFTVKTQSIKQINKATKNENKQTSNIFEFALSGLRYLVSNKTLILLFGLNIPLSALLLSMKWIYNPVFDLFSIPQPYWGVFIGFFSLISIFGSIAYKKIKNLNNKKMFYLSIIFLLSLSIIAFTQNFILFIVSMIVMHFLNRFLDMYYVVEVNNHIKDNIRASLVSLKSLIIRLSSSLYLLFIGYVLGNFNVSYLFIFTALIIVSIWVLFLTVFSNKKLFRQ